MFKLTKVVLKSHSFPTCLINPKSEISRSNSKDTGVPLILLAIDIIFFPLTSSKIATTSD